MLSRRPSVVLAGVKTEELSQLELVLLIKRGFALGSLKAMLDMSTLYSSRQILTRIMGKSIRTLHRMEAQKGVVLLNEYQSAVALQYALALERATAAFGTQRLAENWLEKPCSQLSGEIPLQMLGNLWGYQLVLSYLDRVVLGVYQ